jgi:hypothetical protein
MLKNCRAKDRKFLKSLIDEVQLWFKNKIIKPSDNFLLAWLNKMIQYQNKYQPCN